ncbi:MAG: PilZ domain-containing protein [Zoogloea sp.]|nr:PilZ domain-containing protein [Zoogloea sp.]
MDKNSPADGVSGERRKRQRFVARRWGKVCFWAVIDGARLPVNDLSLEGFSVPFGAPLIEPRQVSFELSLDGIPERIFGVADTMNFSVGTDGGLLGCRFVSFEGDGAIRLHDWLTVHVIATATVRISEREAAEIVSGPSLI